MDLIISTTVPITVLNLKSSMDRFIVGGNPLLD